MTDLDEKIFFLNKLLVDDNWHRIEKHDDIITERKTIVGSNIACFRSYTLINATPKELVGLVWNIHATADSMKSYDPHIENYLVAKNLDEHTRLCHQTNKLPWPMWPRELVYMQHCILKKDVCYILMYSTESKYIPHDHKKYVLAHINISAYVFLPDRNGCKVFRIVHADPSGSIPSAWVNTYATKTISLLKHLKNLYITNG